MAAVCLRSLLTVAIAVTLFACVGGQRLTMVISSTPPDALVHVNDFPRGVTPVEVPYLWIGEYRIQMSLDGYQPVDEVVSVRKPWFYWIPFSSLIVDSLPVPVHHRTHIHRTLVAELPEEF